MARTDKLQQPPEGIIITVGAKMWGHHGYKRWLRGFLQTMKISETSDDFYYWFRQGNQPKLDTHLQYVYLCIGNRIRYRVIFATSYGAGEKTFPDGEGGVKVIQGKAWVLVAGPAVRAPYKITMKGFQGFRYCEKLF